MIKLRSLSLQANSSTLDRNGILSNGLRKSDFEGKLFTRTKNEVDMASRNMYSWWAQYTNMMEDYKERFDVDLACSNPELLRAKLDSLDLQVQRVSRKLMFHSRDHFMLALVYMKNIRYEVGGKKS